MPVDTIHKIALGGGCHWCTEAVFQSLLGVEKVEQGFIASTGENSSFSEAVIVHFDPNRIILKDLVEVHLHTHRSTSNHSMREKYRSAVYYFSGSQALEVEKILIALQSDFDDQLITQVIPYMAFKPSMERFRDYYHRNSEKPFCQNYIAPKLEVLRKTFPKKLRPLKPERSSAVSSE